MKSISTPSAVASLVALGIAASAAHGQYGSTTNQKVDVPPPSANKAGAPAAQKARKFNLSKEAIKPIQALQKAYDAGDAAAFAAALPAAEAAAKNTDDRYAIASLRLNQAIKVNDNAQLLTAIDAVLASGGAAPEQLGALYAKQGELYFNNNNFEGAATVFTKLMELQPNNAEVIMNLAVVRGRQKQHAQALQLIDRAIAAKKAAGQPVPENWYRSALQHSFDGKLSAQSAKASRDLLTAYPTPQNWRNALLVARRASESDLANKLDALRLMRAAKALNTADEYLSLAYILETGNFPAEAKAVIEEGVAANKLTLSNATAADILKRANSKIAEDKAALPGLEARARAGANGQLAVRLADGYFGHRDYAKAAEFYRVALTKGGVDSNLVNNRLGIALAMAGQKAEAETALKKVSGSRAELANLWLLWLNSRG